MQIIFVIGGARSGKSSFALKEASKVKGQKAYIATAEALDDEMKERIEKHKKERGSDWDTYEEPLKIPDVLSDTKDKYSVIILDCLTLWLSNIMLTSHGTGKEDNPPPLEKGGKGGFDNAKKRIQELMNELISFKNSSRGIHHTSRLFIVSNEVGMGIVPENKPARQFRDLAGSLNQKVAEAADEVYLVTAGIPAKIK